MDCVRDAISNAVSKAVSETLSKAMPPSSGESSRGSTIWKEEDIKWLLPSSFLKKKYKAEGKGKAKKKTWTKDIVCLPADCKPAEKTELFFQRD